MHAPTEWGAIPDETGASLQNTEHHTSHARFERTRPSRGVLAVAVAAVVGLLVAIAVLAAASGFVGVAAAEEVGDCTTIDSPGTYELNQDVSSSDAECVTITSSDVVLDGQGHTVEMTSGGDAVNVTADGDLTNVTVRNLRIEDGDRGVVVHARSDGAIVDVSVENNVVNDTTDGLVYLADGHETDATVHVANNEMTNVSQYGVDVDGSGDDATLAVAIVGNHLNTTDGAIESIDGTGANTTLQVAIEDNTLVSGTEEGIDRIDATATNQTVDVTIAENTVTSDAEGIYQLDVDGTGSAVDVQIVDNAFVSNDDGVSYINYGSEQSLTLDISRNEIDAADDGIVEIWGGSSDSTLAATIEDNTIQAGDAGISWLYFDQDTSTVDLSVANNSIDAGDDGIDDIVVDGADATVTVGVLNNTIVAGDGGSDDDGIESIQAGGTGSDVTIDVRENDITADDDGIEGIDVDGTDSTVDVTVAANGISAGNDGVEFDVDGDDQTVAVAILDNEITGFAGYGMEFDQVQLLDAHEVDLVVDGNTLATSEPAIGIELRPATGTEPAAGTMAIEHNDIDVVGNAIHVTDGPVAGIAVHNNHLTGAYGVANDNQTADSYVDATNNYWDASDGPGSEGAYEDPVTGTPADGAGSHVTNSTATVANVHFDPYLEAPPGDGFQVAIDSTNSPVQEGDTLEVTATVTNTGDESDTQPIELHVGGAVRDATTVTLEAGGSQSVTLTWETESGDAGEHTATVASDTDSDERQVVVEQQATVSPPPSTSPASFAVAIDAANDTVVEGDRLNVTATVENTGGSTTTQTVTLSANDTERDATDVRLSGGDATTVTLTWATGAGDAGNHTATVATDDDSDATDVTVLPPARVTIDDQTVASEGTQSVVVSSTYLPRGGFVVVHDANATDDVEPDSVIGVSGFLAPGEHTNLRIALDSDNRSHADTVMAVVHRDGDDDQLFDYGDGGADVPFIWMDEPVHDTARLSVPTLTPEPVTPTPSPEPDISTPSPSPAPTTEPPTPTLSPTPPTDDQPGFGSLVAVLASLAFAVLARRRTRSV